MRDVCILPDITSKTYYMIGPGRRNSVRLYSSIDLLTWYGPQTIFTVPEGLWGDIPIFGGGKTEYHGQLKKGGETYFFTG